MDADIKRARERTMAKMAEVDKTISWLQDEWVRLSELEWCPSDGYIRGLLRAYPAESVIYAVLVTAERFARGKVRRETWAPYVRAIAESHAEEQVHNG